MKQIEVDPNNEQFYSVEFIRGFILGTQRQYEADLADRPQGEWIYKDDDIFAGEYTCSICNSRAEVDLYGQWILSNYCPSCGAHMKGADDD